MSASDLSLDLPQMPVGVARLKFSIIAQEPLQLPYFAGSMLRGAFGHALRRLVCMTRQPSCEGCGLRATCAYPRLFEPFQTPVAAAGLPEGSMQPPPPFVVQPPPLGASLVAEGDTWSFGLNIFGRALGDIALVVEAWRRALAHGLGEARARGTLQAVDLVRRDRTVSLYDAASASLAPFSYESLQVMSFQNAADVVMSLRTPLRLQSNAKRLNEADVSVRRLVGDALRRARLVTAVAGDAQACKLVAAWPVSRWLTETETIPLHTHLRWVDWTRHSSRQRQHMTLGGWLGEMRAERAPPAVQAALRLGAELGLGKETVFGMGQYDVAILGEVP